MKKNKISILNILLFAILAIYSISMIFPMFWALITSVKEQYDFLDNVLGLPVKVITENFATVIKYFEVPAQQGDVQVFHGFWQMFLNTILYVGGCSLTATLIPCITAYATAKFPQKKMSSIIYGIVIVTMMIPIVGSYPAEIDMLQKLGLYNTLVGTWIQKANFLGMYFLVFHAAFKALAKDYSEAAEIDGASEFTVMTRIMLPLVRNAFFTVFLVKFVEFWNDYQMPLLYLPSRPTLSFGLYYISNNTANMISTVPMRMAGCIIILIPIVVIFTIFSDKLMGNITLGGVKG
ncbi:MAG: carbohydrate ABC transporter permease [Tyzzerella sp.]|nr:carbohydrate ABC transporter permease [Tyzzerella sp.]